MPVPPATSELLPSDAQAALPGWARAADVVCAILVPLSLVVGEWGGFRERIGSVRVAITSPYRLLILAVVVGAVRHWLAPRPPIYVDLPRRAARAVRTAHARAALVAALGTRPAILIVGYFALAAFGYVNERPPVRFADNEIINLQGRWDATWYVEIATQGYRYNPDNPTAQQNIVFFPAYPMALRWTGRLFGGSVAAHLLAGTVLTWGLFAFAMAYVFRLARDLIGNDDGARAAVMLTAAYPFAFFYGALYTESLYLLGAVAAFYHARRREYWQTAAWGLLVGLTRPNGCFLSIPLVIVTLAPWLPGWLHAPGAAVHRRGAASGDRPLRRSWRSVSAAVAAAAAPGIGMLIYAAWVWSVTGRPLAWAEGHAAWGRQYAGFGILLSTWYRYFEESGAYVVTSVLPYDSLNALGALFVLALSVPVWRRFGFPYFIFILVNMLPPLAAGGFLSAGRLSAVMFPVFLWLAARVPTTQAGGWVAGFMAIQAMNAAFFYTWRELF